MLLQALFVLNLSVIVPVWLSPLRGYDLALNVGQLLILPVFLPAVLPPLLQAPLPPLLPSLLPPPLSPLLLPRRSQVRKVPRSLE